MRRFPRAFAIVASLLLVGEAWAGGFPSGASTLPLLLTRGTDRGCNQGDFVVCPPPAGDVGLAANKYHSYFVEVPAGTGNLTLEMFDPDDGAGGAAEATAGRDVTVATNAQAMQYTVLNPAGTAQTLRYDRGDGVSTSGGVTTGLATAGGVGVSCTTVGNTTADNSWCPILIVTNPTAGHWELRVAGVNGSGENYYGVRARDTATNRDLNVYARSYIHYGNENVQAGRTYSGSNAFFPYVTEGCQLRAADFDSDDDTGESIRYASRTLVVDRTFTEATDDLSGATAWNDELLTFTTNTDAREYGIWRNECTSSLTNSNHVTPWLGSEMSTASPPTTQPQGGSDRGATAVTSGESYRIYFPNNNGGAPLKPFVEQHLSAAVAGTTPTAGQTATYNVALEITNPTPYAITFSATDTFTSTVPNDTNTGGSGNNIRDYGYVNNSFSTTCGSATTPAGAASGSVVWNPGTVAANSMCTATYQLTLRLGSNVANGTVVPMTGLTTAGSTAAFLDETGTRFIFGPLCALQVTVGTAVAVPVTLSYFDARSLGDDRLSVRFRTATEANTIGFTLLEGTAAASARPLAGGSVSAQGVRSLRNHDYQFTVSGYRGGLLWLEENSGSARHQRHGPFVVGQTAGREAAPAAIDWRTSRAERQASAAASEQAARTSGGREVELRVDRDGAYRVRYEDLLAAGSDWAGVTADRLALTANGVPVPIAVDGAASFGPGSAIRFVGFGRHSSPYTDETVYVLSDAPAQALRMGRIAAATPSSYRSSADRKVEVAPNNLWDFASPLPDPWYAFELYRNGNTYPSAQLSLPLTGPDANVDALLRLSMYGGIDEVEVGGDHALTVTLNGQPLVTADRFDGINPRYLDRSVPAALLHDGTNTIGLALEPNGLGADSVVVDGATLVYRGHLQAQNDRLDFQSAGAETGDALFGDGFGDERTECQPDCTGYQADGFGSLPTSVYRVRGSRVDELPTRASSGTTLRFGGSEEPADRYLAASTAAHLLPTIRLARAPVDLFAGAATWLAIGPASVLPALEPLLAARRNRGLAARAVAIEDVYAQFGDGAADPEAVRRFIRQAAIELGTHFVVLAGGDTYDYKNYSGTGSVSLVPTFYRQTYPIVHYGPTDVPYGDLDGDGRLDLAVGRLPARNASEMALLVSKTLAYEASPSTARPLFAADQSGNGVDFGVGSDSFIGMLDSSFVATRPAADKVYLGTAASPQAARDAFFADLGGGRSLVSYYGHSFPSGWTFNGLLDVSDVQAGLIHNSAAPVIVTQWGCWGAFFVDPQYSTLAHGLLVGGPDGAVALIGATALTDSADDEAFAAQLLPLLSGSGTTLGDALQQAQAAFAAAHPNARDVGLGTVLLGDPAIVLNRN